MRKPALQSPKTIRLALVVVLLIFQNSLLAQENVGALEKMRQQAAALSPLIKSAFGQSLLKAVDDLPAISGSRIVWYNRETRDAISETEAKSRHADALKGYERKEYDEQFYYFTKYGTPLASVHAFDLVGQAGFELNAGARVLDFGYGSIGQLRLLASLGADVTGVEVDPLLKVLYSGDEDTGIISRASSAGKGAAGKLRLLFGFFPKEQKIVDEAGDGYDLFISKNTLKRGYIHPAREVDPRRLVHLGVDDETFVKTVYRMLNSGGFFMIYNLHPAESKPDEPYKPWADGRSPFERDLYQKVGFSVLAFDENDTEFAHKMARAFGWDKLMNLENDLFGTYTLLRK